MASITPSDKDVLRSTSDSPPVHYTIKIQSFSLLAKNDIERYESGEFEAGGYKWKLVIFPSGKSVKDHLSVHLAMAEVSSLRPGWEVYANFRLFLLDQEKDNYLILEDSAGKAKRFHGLKHEWGFEQFIHHKAFNDPSNGYLVDDTCVFGVEVFVHKETSKGKSECLNMIKDGLTFKHTWKIDNFSKLNKACNDSKTFGSGDYQWKIQLYPNGKGLGTGSHISLYLALADDASLSSGSKVLVEYTLRLIDQLNARHVSGKATSWFSVSAKDNGWSRYITFESLFQYNRGFVVKDSCWVEAEVTLLGRTNAQ